MDTNAPQPEPREEVLQALRQLASRGSTVRELVREVQSREGYGEDMYVPVLWYLTKAFGVSLLEVLPIREWMGTSRDEEIDALILPALARTRDYWLAKLAPEYNGTAGVAVAERPAVAHEHRS